MPLLELPVVVAGRRAAAEKPTATPARRVEAKDSVGKQRAGVQPPQPGLPIPAAAAQAKPGARARRPRVAPQGQRHRSAQGAIGSHR